ncbi:MAG: hypothetical protein NTV43_07955 [Methylococcales bacterium]|nr:hypothetical protein [Methylococcales bacterium]
MNHKSLATTLFLAASASAVSTAFATDQIAMHLNVTDCNRCHSSPIQSRSDLKAGVQAAYNKDMRNLTGLIAYLATNQAANTKPVISPIALQWDAEAGQPLTIPLSVMDAEQDAFQLLGTLPGSSFGPEYVANTGLPTVDFKWTPTVAQANKIYTVKFTAKETLSTKKLSSLPVTAKIRVWPAGNRDQAYVKQLVVSTTKWAANKLSLKGKVTLNPLMTASEKTAFLKRTDLTVNISQGISGTGTVIANLLPITLLPNANWTLVDIPLAAPFACSVTVSFEGVKAARLITGAPKTCIK